jgi:hypothetical protein
MAKLHKTALGKTFDMAALRAKNEKVRAVGNMNVNARGDIIDSNNNVIHDANKRVNVMYEKTMQNPAASRRKAPAPAAAPTATVAAPAASPSPAPTKLEPDVSDAEVYSASADLDDDIPNPEK